jgi:hypothetical protein
LGACPPPLMKILNFLKANPSFSAYLKKVELAKKESIFLLLFYKKWFESEYDLHLILLTKFDLSISNSLSQIHIEKISFKRNELYTDKNNCTQRLSHILKI